MSKGRGTRTTDPLGPLTRVVRFLWSVTAVLVAGATVLGAVVGAVNGHPECFRTDLPVVHRDSGARVSEGVRSTIEVENVCIDGPTALERVFGFLDTAPTAFGSAIALLLLLVLLEKASRDGIHTRGTAERVRRLGWFVLVALPAATLVEAVAVGWLLERALPQDLEALALLSQWDVPWWAVVTGVGLLALGKILWTSADMREDLEGTV
ncbi:hypothetical protein [Saccharothrix xinjiangensis]|uniref:DUF2975 domain-containing protein n=1 Tax=Saccharothrix xinjiangensis TaxID=204798 RepID=A0ABV9YHG8_9PSEU